MSKRGKEGNMDLIQLSKELAQKVIEADFFDAMIHNAPERARVIRELSDNGANNLLIQDYRKYQRAIYIALKTLKDLEESIKRPDEKKNVGLPVCPLGS